LPRPGYLATLRELCTTHGTVLIFDEVMTGFRVARGGAQAREGIRPDLTTLGKVIGGGLPAAAFGGRAEIMAELAPDGPVYQAGTLSGNPVAMAAGIATLGAVAQDQRLYERLETLGLALTRGLKAGLDQHGVPSLVNCAGAMFSIFFTRDDVSDLRGSQTTDRRFFAKYYAAMLERGVYFAPSPFESNFLCAAHTPAEIDRTVAASDSALRAMHLSGGSLGP
jgi:glutamate-1-semialdehyde 2,1-aminomutase